MGDQISLIPTKISNTSTTFGSCDKSNENKIVTNLKVKSFTIIIIISTALFNELTKYLSIIII